MRLPVTLVAFSLPVAIILTNLLALTFSDSTFKIYFKNSEDLHYALNVTSYLKGVSQLDSDYFSGQAVLHMQDVKTLFDAAKITNALVLLVFIGALAYLYSQKKYQQVKKAIGLGIIIITLLILTVFAAASLDFTSAFTVFHKIFFRNNLWLFPPGDNLIKLFSLDFFIHYFQKLITNILVVTLAVLILLRFLPKDDSKSN